MYLSSACMRRCFQYNILTVRVSWCEYIYLLKIATYDYFIDVNSLYWFLETTRTFDFAGQLPALQDENGLQLPVLENDWDEFEAARCVISALKERQDLDSALDSGQAAQCAAFTALIRMYLEPASIWTQWAEPEGYRQMKVKFPQRPFLTFKNKPFCWVLIVSIDQCLNIRQKAFVSNNTSTTARSSQSRSSNKKEQKLNWAWLQDNT